MKNYFKRLAARVVTVYANRIYKQAVDAAEMRHANENKQIFVITSPANPKVLMTLSTNQFLDLRHRYGIPSNRLTIQNIKSTCWYHTANPYGKDAVRDKEMRRLAFVRDRLKAANLM